MTENTEKELFLRYYNRELTEDEVKGMSDSELISLFLPSNFNSVHDSNRVILMDSIVPALVRYYNIAERDSGYRILMRTDVFPQLKDIMLSSYKKRYTYHGGNCGIFDGFFSISDKYYRILSENGKITAYDSIPNHNIAHFFCDYLNTDKKVEDAFGWFIDDYFWEGYGKNAIASAFHRVG